MKSNSYYLLDVLCQRLDYPNLERAVRAQLQNLKANVVLIEDQASGTS